MAQASRLCLHRRDVGATGLHRRTSFTLIELVVSISVGVVISGIAGTLIWNSSRQRAEIAARTDMVDAGSVAVEVMLRYVREIPQGETGGLLNGDALIDLASATELHFDAGQTRFRLDAGADTLKMSTDSGVNWYPLLKDVSGFALSYFNGAGTALTSFPLSAADYKSVRHIGVDVQMSRGSENARLRTAIYLRSFMNEG